MDAGADIAMFAPFVFNFMTFKVFSLCHRIPHIELLCTQFRWHLTGVRKYCEILGNLLCVAHSEHYINYHIMLLKIIRSVSKMSVHYPTVSFNFRRADLQTMSSCSSISQLLLTENRLRLSQFSSTFKCLSETFKLSTVIIHTPPPLLRATRAILNVFFYFPLFLFSISHVFFLKIDANNNDVFFCLPSLYSSHNFLQMEKS